MAEAISETSFWKGWKYFWF